MQSWEFCFAVVAGWVNREQQQALEYAQTQIAVLLELHGKKRLVLNDDQGKPGTPGEGKPGTPIVA